MSNPCILGPADTTSWRLDRDEFVTALSALWPEADIALPIDPDASRFPVTWSVRNWEGDEEVPPWLDGSLDSAMQVSSLRGDPELVADYILWFRNQITTIPLVLMVDGQLEPLVVLPTTAREEVIAFIR